jgi:hypothetical protein
MKEDKHAKFLRLAKLRGERVIKDLQLIANLSNRNNYEYSENEVRAIFSAIEEELKLAKSDFAKKKSRGIRFER